MYKVSFKYDCIYIYPKDINPAKLANKLGTVFYGCFKIKTGFYYIPRTSIKKTGFNGFINVLIPYV
jgi:hypothetical protein